MQDEQTSSSIVKDTEEKPALAGEVEVVPSIAIANQNNQPDPFLEATFQALAGQLAASSRRQYQSDARHFALWLSQRGLSLAKINRDAMIEYRLHLADTYPVAATSSRMLVVAKRLLDEAVKRGVLSANPAGDIKGFRSGGDNETTHSALTKAQTRALLAAVDRTTARGKRDYALLMVLVYTGIRRAECAGLTLGDLREEQGYHVAIIRHGKGNKRRVVKLPVPVRQAIDDWLAALSITPQIVTSTATPLFIQFRKGDNPDKRLRGISTNAIENIVKYYANLAELPVHLSPHGLRASFVTLSLEGGARLQQVQYAVGHADPRTTERYQKRKLNLEDHASDYLHL